MTAIAVKLSKKTIEIAGDTQTSWGWNKYSKQAHSDKQIQSNGKIFQVNDLTIGCAGSVNQIGLLQIFCKTHKPKEMERDSVLDWLIEFKDWANKKAGIALADFSFHGILISEGRVFSFYDFMDVGEVKSFEAVGSGMWLCIGAMELGASAEEAVKVAIKYDLYCGGNSTKLIIQK